MIGCCNICVLIHTPSHINSLLRLIRSLFYVSLIYLSFVLDTEFVYIAQIKVRFEYSNTLDLFAKEIEIPTQLTLDPSVELSSNKSDQKGKPWHGIRYAVIRRKYAMGNTSLKLYQYIERSNMSRPSWIKYFANSLGLLCWMDDKSE